MRTRTGVFTAVCRCGHDIDAHEHFRSGRDCSTCGPERCRRFTRRMGIGLPAVLRLPTQMMVVSGPAWNRLRGR